MLSLLQFINWVLRRELQSRVCEQTSTDTTRRLKNIIINSNNEAIEAGTYRNRINEKTMAM